MKIETIPFHAQVADVQAATDKDSYELLTMRYFHDEKWMPIVEEELQRPEFEETPQEFYQMMGLVTVLFAQYGFQMMSGMPARHKKYGWEKSFLDPYHQLALAIYAADINEQAYPIKKEHRKKVDDPEIDVATLGITLPVSKGKVHDYYMRDAVVGALAEARAKKDVPITLPNRRVNRKLSKISFTGEDAEAMPREVFQSTVLPKVDRALRGVIKPVDLFVRNK